MYMYMYIYIYMYVYIASPTTSEAAVNAMKEV